MNIIVGLDQGSYTFNKTAKTITLSGITSNGTALTTLLLEQIILIVNVTDNISLYNYVDATLGGTVSGLVITVNYDTSSMSNTDKLFVCIKIPDPIEDILRLIERMVKNAESLGMVDSSQRQRVAVDTFGSTLNLGTLTTLTTVTNPVPVGDVATLAGLSPKWNFIDTARIAYNTGIRNGLVWS